MLQLTIKQAKDFFFDRQAVISAVDKASRKVLTRSGALVRGIARRSMKQVRPDAPPAPPGSPPRSRKGLLKRFMFYVFDPSSKTVVVGPALLPGMRRDLTIPQLHEHGGETRAVIREIRWEKGRRRRVETRKGKLRFPRRPYMEPALAKVRPQLPQFWKDVLNR
ncbi:MAG TPA: hypothetical protein PLO20_13100 [Thermogutta sp.]|nr:hypothetical protein [Thermogutta sp.]